MKLSSINLVYLSLLLYIFSCFLGSTLITISFIAAVVLLAIDLFRRVSKKEKISFYFDTKLKLFSGVFLALVLSKQVLNFIQGVDFDFLETLSSVFKNTFLYFWLIYLIQNFDYSKKLDINKFKRYFVMTIASASLITSLYIFLQFLGLIELNHKGYFGIISQPFTSSGLLLAGIFSTLYFHNQNLVKKTLVLLLGLIQILALLLLSQISAWFGLLIGLFFINFKQRIVSFKSLFLFILVAIALLFFVTEYVPRMKRKVSWFSSFEKLTTNKSIQCRVGLWQANFKDFDKVIFFGRDELVDYSCVIKDKATILPHAHSIYLQPLFKGGVFKLLIWLGFYMSLLFFLLKTYAENQVFLGYFIALSTEGIFEYWWGDSEVKNLFLAIMFFIVINTSYRQKNTT